MSTIIRFAGTDLSLAPSYNAVRYFGPVELLKLISFSSLLGYRFSLFCTSYCRLQSYVLDHENEIIKLWMYRGYPLQNITPKSRSVFLRNVKNFLGTRAFEGPLLIILSLSRTTGLDVISLNSLPPLYPFLWL